MMNPDLALHRVEYDLIALLAQMGRAGDYAERVREAAGAANHPAAPALAGAVAGLKLAAGEAGRALGLLEPHLARAAALAPADDDHDDLIPY